MKRWVMLVLLVGACPSKQATGPGVGSQQGSGGGSDSAPVLANAKTCDDVRGKVESLYRAEAATKEPKRVEGAVADNTAMAMTDCAKDPTTVVPCLAKAPSVAELEKQCLVPLDDEGTEGERR
jgi:hypothetical protein